MYFERVLNQQETAPNQQETAPNQQETPAAHADETSPGSKPNNRLQRTTRMGRPHPLEATCASPQRCRSPLFSERARHLSQCWEGSCGTGTIRWVVPATRPPVGSRTTCGAVSAQVRLLKTRATSPTSATGRTRSPAPHTCAPATTNRSQASHT